MLICVTNRALCKEDFYKRIEKIAREKPYAIILREKDLSEAEYEKIAERVWSVCKKYDVLFIINTFCDAAEKLGVKAVHLPFDAFEKYKNKGKFKLTGTSVHSTEQARLAEKNGADYIICGHIFNTDCKKGLKPRGLEFVSEIKKAVSIPVFAIGGINEKNAENVIKAGADGVCIMSALMDCGDERIKDICAKTR